MCDCSICNGATREECLDDVHLRILEYGFTMQAVGASLSKRGMVYSIGLVDKHDHPELVIAGRPIREAARIVESLAMRVTEGVRYKPGETILLGGELLLGVGAVHERHLKDGLLAVWREYYGRLGRIDLSLEAVQILVSEDDHCFECQTTQPRLDLPLHQPYDGVGRQKRRGHRTGRRSA